MSHNIYVDIHVDSTLKYLRVEDFSNWLHIADKPSVIEITVPGSKEPVVKYFDKHKVNKYHSIDLGLNCQEGCDDPELHPLPDGIYTITVKGSPSSFSKTVKYLKHDSLDIEMDKLFIDNIDKPHKDKFLITFRYLENLLRGIKANIRLDRINVAANQFSSFQDYLEDLTKCPECYVFM